MKISATNCVLLLTAAGSWLVPAVGAADIGTCGDCFFRGGMGAADAPGIRWYFEHVRRLK